MPTHVNGVLDFANGAVGTFLITSDFHGTGLPHIEIYGTEGSLRCIDPNNFGGTLYLRRAFAYDSVVLAARWYHSFTDDDYLAALSIEYEFSSGTAVELAAQFFTGVEEGLFGQFAERDRITLSLSHTF